MSLRRRYDRTKTRAKLTAQALFDGYLWLSGKYVPLPEADRAVRTSGAVRFGGDAPAWTGGSHTISCYEFVRPRVPSEAREVIYTGRGIGWAGGRVHQRLSLRKPNPRYYFSPPVWGRLPEVPSGCVLQSSFLGTYGDWFAQPLMALVPHLPLPAPLLVPRILGRRPYVARDLAALGVEVLPVDRAVRVGRVVALPERQPFYSFGAADVRAFRAAFRIDPPRPRPGSVLYISRDGERGEGPRRSYPSRAAADVVRGLGGTVLLARDATPDTYRSLAAEAETVVADHGAAMCNLVYFDSRAVVEIFTDTWWTPNFLYLAGALGIDRYTLVCGDGADADPTRLRRTLTDGIRGLLPAPPP